MCRNPSSLIENIGGGLLAILLVGFAKEPCLEYGNLASIVVLESASIPIAFARSDSKLHFSLLERLTESPSWCARERK